MRSTRVMRRASTALACLMCGMSTAQPMPNMDAEIKSARQLLEDCANVTKHGASVQAVNFESCMKRGSDLHAATKNQDCRSPLCADDSNAAPAALECLSALGFESDPSGERLTLSPLDECEPVLEACLAGVQQGIAEARSRGQLTEEEVQEEARASAKRQELEELKRRQCEPAPPLPILICTSHECGLAVWRRLERKAAAKQKAKREEQAAADARAAAASAPADSSFAEQMEAARLSRQRSAEEAGRGAEKTPPGITAALVAARKQQRESGANRDPHPNPPAAFRLSIHPISTRC